MTEELLRKAIKDMAYDEMTSDVMVCLLNYVKLFPGLQPDIEKKLQEVAEVAESKKAKKNKEPKIEVNKGKAKNNGRT